MTDRSAIDVVYALSAFRSTGFSTGIGHESRSWETLLSREPSADGQIDQAGTPADCCTNPKPAVARSDKDVANPHGKTLIGEWTSNHKPVSGDNGWWCWEGYRNFLMASGTVICLDATDMRPANDALPDPNLTSGGLSGTDWPQ